MVHNSCMLRFQKMSFIVNIGFNSFDCFALLSEETLISIDLTAWHSYKTSVLRIVFGRLGCFKFVQSISDDQHIDFVRLGYFSYKASLMRNFIFDRFAWVSSDKASMMRTSIWVDMCHCVILLPYWQNFWVIHKKFSSIWRSN